MASHAVMGSIIDKAHNKVSFICLSKADKGYQLMISGTYPDGNHPYRLSPFYPQSTRYINSMMVITLTIWECVVKPITKYRHNIDNISVIYPLYGHAKIPHDFILTQRQNRHTTVVVLPKCSGSPGHELSAVRTLAATMEPSARPWVRALTALMMIPICLMVAPSTALTSSVTIWSSSASVSGAGR